MQLRLLGTLLFTLIFSVSFSQSLRLSGRVVNERNEPVAGASVRVTGAAGTATNAEGNYTLSLNAGTYTIEVSAVGFETKRITEVEVGTGLTNELNVTLVTAARTQDAVVVRTTSRRQESTASLINFQRNNTALSSGLAADFIRRTPDRNTGEILKRVSGASVQDNRFVIVRGLSDRYNSAIINNAQFPSTEPDRKVFSFDIIPSALVDNIVINKTASPELTGEFAGGLVQINTKDIPTRDVLSVGFSLGYNSQSTFRDFTSNARGSRDFLGFDDGTRALPDYFPRTPQQYRALGATKSGQEQQFALSRAFPYGSYRTQTGRAAPNYAFGLTWGNTARFNKGGSFGSILSLNYRRSNALAEVARQLNQFDGSINTSLTDATNRYSSNIGALANFSYAKGRHKVSFKNLFNQLYDDNYYTRTGISYDRLQDVSFSSSVVNQRSLYSGQLEGEHQFTTRGLRLRWNANGSYNWKSQPDLRTLAYFRPQGSTDAFELDNDDTRRFFSNLKDYSYGANGTLSVPFSFAGQDQVFRAGGSTLIRLRDFRSRIFRYDPTNLASFNTGLNNLPPELIFSPENIGANGFVINEFTNNQDKYFGISVLDGVFGLFDNKIGESVRFVWGLRAEYFNQFLTTRDVTARRIVVNNEKWDLLPSANLTINPTTKQSIRLAASRTVSRPEFREIAPFSFYDYEVNYAINGNPDLQRGSILNGDIRYEYYPRGGEQVSFGVFYKKFTDPIEFILDDASVVNRRTYSYQNTDEAYTYGAELELRKGLEALGSSFENFSLFANLTYIKSRVTINRVSSGGEAVQQNRPLQGQSPYLVNAGLQYNGKKGWNGSLLYNRVGERLALVGNTEYPDVYERPRNLLDFQVARKVGGKGELKLVLSDLLNNAFYFYENTAGGTSFKNGGDRLFYSYRPGTTVNLGFTYDFDL